MARFKVYHYPEIVPVELSQSSSFGCIVGVVIALGVTISGLIGWFLPRPLTITSYWQVILLGVLLLALIPTFLFFRGARDSLFARYEFYWDRDRRLLALLMLLGGCIAGTAEWLWPVNR